MIGQVLTYTGKMVCPMHPNPDDIYIEDIAHALGNICRWGGMCSEFYSVAQHSVYVSRLLPKELALAGLLHDASEAYLGDVCNPLKNTDPWREYREIEHALQCVIFGKFGIEVESVGFDPRIKEADYKAAIDEAHRLMPKDLYWGSLIGSGHYIFPWDHDVAGDVFLKEFNLLTNRGSNVK
jgi:uncharacterized protein